MAFKRISESSIGSIGDPVFTIAGVGSDRNVVAESRGAIRGSSDSQANIVNSGNEVNMPGIIIG